MEQDGEHEAEEDLPDERDDEEDHRVLERHPEDRVCEHPRVVVEADELGLRADPIPVEEGDVAGVTDAEIDDGDRHDQRGKEPQEVGRPVAVQRSVALLCSGRPRRHCTDRRHGGTAPFSWSTADPGFPPGPAVRSHCPDWDCSVAAACCGVTLPASTELAASSSAWSSGPEMFASRASVTFDVYFESQSSPGVC